MTEDKKPARQPRKRKPKPEKLAIQSTQRVSMELKQSGEEIDSEETIEKDVHVFITEPAYLRVNAGVTKNLGNFESLRVDVAITMPCYREMLDETFDIMADKVAVLLGGEVDEYLRADEGE
jgi:hypothetical protein